MKQLMWPRPKNDPPLCAGKAWPFHGRGVGVGSEAEALRPTNNSWAQSPDLVQPTSTWAWVLKLICKRNGWAEMPKPTWFPCPHFQFSLAGNMPTAQLDPHWWNRFETPFWLLAQANFSDWGTLWGDGDTQPALFCTDKVIHEVDNHLWI